MGMACRAGVLYSLLAVAGNVSAQEPLVLKDLKLLRPPGDPCTITFGTAPGLQIVARSSSDLKCWVFAGGCDETAQGDYQFIDVGSIEQPGQLYQFEIHDPKIELPLPLEQLRINLGDEQFAEWLQTNLEQSGTLQGITDEDLERLEESQLEEIQQTEDLLIYWLRDFYNESAPLLPELELPPLFEEIRLDWGDYDFAQLLVDNLNQSGNLHGICEPLFIEWEQNEPLVLIEFQTAEEMMGIWLENYILELPPIIQEAFPEVEQPLPPQFEQLRMELGDEGFAGWLLRNREQSGTLQGITESELPEPGSVARDEVEAAEAVLEKWLNDFLNRDPR